jgi:hypothetical protein
LWESIDAPRQSRITLRSIPATLAVSGRTQNNDSFAAPKIMSFNEFLHFAQCTQLRDLSHRSMPRLDIVFGHGVFLVFQRLRAASTDGGAGARPDYSIGGSHSRLRTERFSRRKR